MDKWCTSLEVRSDSLGDKERKKTKVRLFNTVFRTRPTEQSMGGLDRNSSRSIEKEIINFASKPA